MLYVVAFLFIVGLFFFFFRRRNISLPRRKQSRSQENANLIKVLLDLGEEPREQLFQLYKEQFGDNAALYARHTYQKWKSGTVRPNKHTFRRFLINLPRVMSFDLKCEVLRELRESYCARDNYRISVSTHDWKSKLTPLVDDIIKKSINAELPASLNHRLTWLAEDDMKVAHAILAESQARQSLNALSLLEKELSNIEELLNNAHGRRRVTHVLRLPLGTITLQIRSEDGNG